MGVVTTIIGTEIIKSVVDSILKKVNLNMFHSEKDEMIKFQNNFSRYYGIHFNEICNWSESIPFIGLKKPKKTKLSSIELIIASEIVEIGNKNESIVSEKEILNSNENILLVGAPGAGKTTTLKRLILKYFSEFSNLTNHNFPILVRFRDIPTESTLFKYILDIFSISHQDKIIKQIKEVKTKDKRTKEIYSEEVITETIVTYVGDTPINNFIASFLNNSNCFLILDGIDELHKSIQVETLRQVEKLGLKLDKAKIIMTVRKSALNKVINGFNIYEISSLSNKQIKKIAQQWLKNNDDFIIELEKKPYKDLANRPIFLTFLLILFEKYASLPTQPSEVYEDTTYLILKKWDEHRDITRLSTYSDFNTRKKIKFISELSYHLTFKIKQKTFTSRDLEDIYNKINIKYELPNEHSKAVVQEVESHTGLIVESTYKKFEFSHLSIQEFLCAKHIINLPYSKETTSYFNEYPEPLAIAICISSEPSIWFANLVLNSSLNITNFKNRKKVYFASMYTLLSRLLVETPSFSICSELGFTFLYLFTHLYKIENFNMLLDEWFHYPKVKESLALCLKSCSFYRTKNSFLIKRNEAIDTDYFINIITNGELPHNYFQALINEKLIKLNNDTIT